MKDSQEELVFDDRRFADALTIINEAGFAGLNFYSHSTKEDVEYKSKSGGSMPIVTFSQDEFRQYLEYAAQNGFVDVGPAQQRLISGGFDSKPWLVKLSAEGRSKLLELKPKKSGITGTLLYLLEYWKPVVVGLVLLVLATSLGLK
ncbi:hypothetical protein [Ruegeria arenilitoris]|uniref:hypothetical protein n=1 Tax=Ruegeria arenilitoris TaxID=1173585 RepID=UPI00147B3DC3|nr:hypothetical protein [Ruegeria arenilitoris]